MMRPVGDCPLSTHAEGGRPNYRYYVSRALQVGGGPIAGETIRIPAAILEEPVLTDFAD